ncbi:hypothetical protein N752_03725 [Desulforamulus aquiferis]|nr:hypothetical protein [Desulforamulus aquiferis]RYD06445.1 hypothetical protein N752_03725 [Desulforamulus aquiferis]
MFDIVCYRLKGHLNYQCQICPAGSSLEDVVETWQNVLDTHRVSGFKSEEEARKYIIENYDTEL